MSSVRWQAPVLGVVAFVAAPFMITGLYRIGVPGGFPFLLLLAAAAAAFVLRHRAVAVGFAAGTVAWAVALAIILTETGDGIDSIG